MAQTLCLVVGLLLSLVCCSAVPLAEFYPYGIDQGNLSVVRGLDVYSPNITLQIPFPFFGVKETILYVINHGYLSFEVIYGEYRAQDVYFDENFSQKLVAGFWSDVDTSGTGIVWYQSTTASSILQRATADVKSAFEKTNSFSATFVFVATWDHVGYAYEGVNKTNTFQIVLVTDGTLSFVIFHYADGELQWSREDTDTFSGVLAGLVSNISTQSYVIPGSLEDGILDVLVNSSNVGRPGAWIFKVDTSNVEHPSRVGCSEQNILTITPRHGNILGGTVVQLFGPCFDNTTTYKCTFGSAWPVNVEYHNQQAFCVQPTLREVGEHLLKLTRTVENQERTVKTTKFYSLSFLETSEIEIVNDELLFCPNDEVTIQWDPTAFSLAGTTESVVTANIFPLISTGLPQRTLFSLTTVNNGSLVLKLDPDLISTLGMPIYPMVIKLSISVSTANPAIWSDIFYYTTIPGKVFTQECKDWLDMSKRETERDSIKDSVAPCPCNEFQARLPNSGMAKERRTDKSFKFFYERASLSYHQTSLAGDPRRHSQQCCYDDVGELVFRKGGGSADYFSVNTEKFTYFDSFLTHFEDDLEPFLYCCKGNQTNEPSFCDNYFNYRPSDNCSSFSPPVPACIYGDPHIVSLDGYKYTFNGKGEFTLIETTDNSFALQGRMIEATDANGSLIAATVFSATVAQQEHSDLIQFQLGPEREGIVTLVNGEQLDIGDLPEVALSNVSILNLGNDTYGARFSSGAYVEVKEEHGIISVLLVSLPTSFEGSTKGLMGPYNRNTSDDLLPKGGSQPLPLDSTIENIHWQFGITWIIDTPELSLFTYVDGESWADFYDPDFSPVLQPDFVSSELQEEAEELCDGDVSCLFDVAATSRVDIGLSTLVGTQELEQITLMSAPIICDPPCENGACVSNNTCSCQPGYTGAYCETAEYTDDCVINPCQNGATCRKLAGDTACLCPAYYTGVTCGLLVPLELQCEHSIQTGNVINISNCTTNKPLQDLLCFVNEQPRENCMFPFVQQVAALGTGDHHVRVQATDTFNLTANYTVDFQVLQLEIECETEVDNDDVFTASCKTNNPNRFIMCSFNEEEPVPCSTEYKKNVSLLPPGVYTLKVDAFDIFNLSSQLIVNYNRKSLKVTFINSSPMINGSTVRFDFRANRPVLSQNCYMRKIKESNVTSLIDCQHGHVVLSDVVPGSYTFIVRVKSRNDESDVSRRLFHIGQDNSDCFIYLVNNGITVKGKSVMVEFWGTGSIISYKCALDEKPLHFCTSPFTAHNLMAGNHKVKIFAEGCEERITKAFRFYIQ